MDLNVHYHNIFFWHLSFGYRSLLAFTACLMNFIIGTYRPTVNTRRKTGFSCISWSFKFVLNVRTGMMCLCVWWTALLTCILVNIIIIIIIYLEVILLFYYLNENAGWEAWKIAGKKLKSIKQRIICNFPSIKAISRKKQQQNKQQNFLLLLACLELVITSSQHSTH